MCIRDRLVTYPQKKYHTTKPSRKPQNGGKIEGGQGPTRAVVPEGERQRERDSTNTIAAVENMFTGMTMEDCSTLCKDGSLWIYGQNKDYCQNHM